MAQDNSSSSVVQTHQKVGHPWRGYFDTSIELTSCERYYFLILPGTQTNCRDTVLTRQHSECIAYWGIATFFLTYQCIIQNRKEKNGLPTQCHTFKAQSNVSYFVTKFTWQSTMFIVQWMMWLCCKNTLYISINYHSKLSQYSQLTGEKRKNQRKQNTSSQKDFFTKRKNKNKAATTESFWMAHFLVKQRKPFTDGDLFKLCLIGATEETCSEKINLYQPFGKVGSWKIEDDSSNINRELQDKWFQVVVLSSWYVPDITDSAQLLFTWRANSRVQRLKN